MEISIVIVNWNTRELLRQCLLSLRTYACDVSVEVIVVDNDSGDGSCEMMEREFPWVKLIQSGGNLGFGRASNQGARFATAPLVLFLNPDTEVGPATLRKMVDFMNANPQVGALGCRIRDVIGGIKQLGVQWFPSPLTETFKYLALSRSTFVKLRRIVPYHDPMISGCVRKLYGACLLVRSRVLQEVGSFDERFFMYCEDVDLCRRITDAGWKLYYLSEAEILHWGGRASSKAPSGFAVLMGCESFSKLMRKYYGWPGVAGYRLVALAGATVRLGLLALLRARERLGWRAEKDLKGSVNKYVTVIKWTLGLQKPVIQQRKHEAGSDSVCPTAEGSGEAVLSALDYRQGRRWLRGSQGGMKDEFSSE